jgi:hypothetical protein
MIFRKMVKLFGSFRSEFFGLDLCVRKNFGFLGKVVFSSSMLVLSFGNSVEVT